MSQVNKQVQISLFFMQNMTDGIRTFFECKIQSYPLIACHFYIGLRYIKSTVKGLGNEFWKSLTPSK